MAGARMSIGVGAFSLSAALLAVGCDPYAGAPPQRTEGRLHAYVADEADGTSRTGYTLEGDTGTFTELEPAPELEAHVGERVSVRGRMVPGEHRLLVDGITRIARADDVGRSTQAIVNGAPRTVRVAAILLNFDGVAAQPATPAGVRGYLETVRAYYQEISFGIWNVQSEVFGPFSVPKPADCELGRIGELARTAAANAGVSLAGFDHVAVTLPRNDDSKLDCACGLAFVGRTPAQQSPEVQRTSLYTCVEANAFAHELGHAFGLGHASTANCNGEAFRPNIRSACTISEYGNLFNTMGNGLGHMNAFQKTTMRWLDRCNNVRVTRTATFDLVPIQRASEGVQSLQIPTGDTQDGQPTYYYVEYRDPSAATFNAADGNTRRERGPGVHIDVAQGYDVRGGDARPILLDLSTGTPGAFTDPRLTAGRAYADPRGRVTVSVLETNTTRARVEVTFPGGGAGANTCNDGSLPPGSTGPSEIAATVFQHCSFGGWSVALPPGDYTTAQLVALGAPDADASSINVRAGFEVTLFEGADFTGRSLVLTETSSCLVSSAFNDVASSIRVRAIPVVMDGGVASDAGVVVDAGVITDAGVGAPDAGTGADAGRPSGSDAGTEEEGGGGRFGSCAATHVGGVVPDASALYAFLVLTMVLARRRTART